MGHKAGWYDIEVVLAVSIPQSEFCPLGLVTIGRDGVIDPTFQFLSRNSVRWDKTVRGVMLSHWSVSIPQSEFCPLGHSTDQIAVAVASSFNSSVGILSVGTGIVAGDHTALSCSFNSSVGILSVGT